MTGTASAARTAILRSEARLFLRDPGSVFWIALFPTMLLVILGFIPAFREPIEEMGDGTRVIDLYVPVVVILALIMTGAQSMPTVLAGYREHGILRRLSTTPARPSMVLGAQVILQGGAAAFGGILALALGRAIYGVPLPEQPFGYLLAYLLTACAALSLGALITAVTPTAKAANVVGAAVLFPMMFTAGVWIPLQGMPDALREVVEFTPFGAAAGALDQAAAGAWPDWMYLLVVVVWAAALLGAAARWFRWS